MGERDDFAVRYIGVMKGFFLKCLNLIFSLTFLRAEGSPGWPQLHMINC